MRAFESLVLSINNIYAEVTLQSSLVVRLGYFHEKYLQNEAKGSEFR